MEYNYMFTGDTLFISAEGKTWLLGSADADKRSKVLALIKEGKPWPELKAILEVKESEEMRKWCESASVEGSGITFNESTILIDGQPIYGSLCSQIQLMHKEGLPLDPMVNFVRKMRKNPSYRIREQLWGFMEACQADGGFTIAEDGDIMAYKVVTSDFKDKHTGTFDNSIGSIVEMPRCDVDDDPNNTCSSGLHFCAYSYVKSFSCCGDRLVLVKINPADVVSIPTDYGNAKARCCRYQVVREVDAPVNRPVWKDEERKNERQHEAEDSDLEYSLGDKVKVVIKNYDFSDDTSKRTVIGRIVALDSTDEYQPYRIRFFDGDEIAEWWIEADDVVELISSGDEPKPSFEKNEWCWIYDTCKGKIIEVDNDDGTCLVKYKDSDGDVREEWFQAFDLTEGEECAGAPEADFKHYISDEDDDQDATRLFKKKLEELENFLKESMKKDEKTDKILDSEDFVRNWLSTSAKKMIIAFLESQYNDIMDARMRLNMMNEVPVSLIVRKLMDWYFEEYDGNISEKRVWDKIRAAIEVWLTR